VGFLCRLTALGTAISRASRATAVSISVGFSRALKPRALVFRNTQPAAITIASTAIKPMAHFHECINPLYSIEPPPPFRNALLELTRRGGAISIHMDIDEILHHRMLECLDTSHVDRDRSSLYPEFLMSSK
jgi:hypothetical protein